MTLDRFDRNDLSRLAEDVGHLDGAVGFYVSRGRFGGYDLRQRHAEDVRFADDPVIFHGEIRECRAYLIGRRDAHRLVAA